MRIQERRLKSAAVWLIMAAFCALIGFFIVFHYASHERPSEHFAIVIDAGSTQTRSSLYQITIHVPELSDWTERVLEQFGAYEHQPEQQVAPADLDESKFKFPLGNLLQVRQVSSCVNGGPLASIASRGEASELIRSCLIKFARHIKLLDFVGATSNSLASNNTGQADEQEEQLLEADEVSRQLALTDHRVNSVTHMYLGATAGMRALEQLDQRSARQKLDWIGQAISSSNELILSDEQSPFVNKGFVGIIEGSDEAAFGWISVNFVCDTLAVHAPHSPATRQIDSQSEQPVYQLDTGPASELSFIENSAHSIGTLELGGASAQMAFQVAASRNNNNNNNNKTRAGSQILDLTSHSALDQQELSLFGGHYRMATRSDLCLGMSQAVLRLNYLVLHRAFASATNQSASNQRSAQEQQQQQQQLVSGSSLELANPCIQRGARITLTGQQLGEQWQGACLAAPSASQLDPLRAQLDASFRRAMASRKSIEFIGTGQTNQCDLLLTQLIEPDKCRRHFSLCPSNKNLERPPPNMPFVTISGYNHALNVLALERQTPLDGGQLAHHKEPHEPEGESRHSLAVSIDEKLGGNSISYAQLVAKTSDFCATDASQLLAKYPKVNPKFQHIICLQLVYIRKLLTEFYRFDPASSWSQIKFLVFAPKSVPSQFAALKKASASSDVKQVKLDARRDIGWTLGLLLNATSYQLETDNSNVVHFHHGASIMYIIRITILLILACCLIAIGLLVAGVVEVQRAQEQAEAYISHSSSSSSASYDVSHLAPYPRHMNTNTKPTGLKYVLTS